MVEDILKESVQIPAGDVKLEGSLCVSRKTRGVVIFAHGSGSSRLSPRNRFVAQFLQQSGIGTLLFDLLTRKEDTIYENRFNIDLLTERLKTATSWLRGKHPVETPGVGYFGASTGAAAALRAAADLGPTIRAIVSRGGRPDMAGEALRRVQSPTLLIVGGYDDTVIKLNREAYGILKSEKRLTIVPGATHLFEEPGKVEEVARLAAEWFTTYLLSGD